MRVVVDFVVDVCQAYHRQTRFLLCRRDYATGFNRRNLIHQRGVCILIKCRTGGCTTSVDNWQRQSSSLILARFQ